jgi:hypothetical protein
MLVVVAVVHQALVVLEAVVEQVELDLLAQVVRPALLVNLAHQVQVVVVVLLVTLVQVDQVDQVV